MRGDGDDSFNPRLFKEGGIVLRQFFEKGLLTHPPGFISAAGFLLPENPKIDLCFLKDLDEGR